MSSQLRPETLAVQAGQETSDPTTKARAVPIYQTAAFTFDSTEPIDICWLLSYLSWGAAALHPSMVSLTATAPDTETTFTRRRLAALTVAVLVAPAVLAVETLLGIAPSVCHRVMCSGLWIVRIFLPLISAGTLIGNLAIKWRIPPSGNPSTV